MYVVRNANGEVVVMASRYEDAMAVVKSGAADKETYTLEKM